MTKSLVVLLSVLLGACTHMNYYQGSDAVSIPVPCDEGLVTAGDGLKYQRFVQILEIDGSFTGSGQGCRDHFVYHVQPGVRHLKIMSNYVDEKNSVQRVGFVLMSADLRPNGSYTLHSKFDGRSMEVEIRGAETGALVAKESTNKVERQALASVNILPILIQAK